MSRHLFLVLIVATAGVLIAQDPPNRVGRLNFINGAVSFQPDGVSEWVPATVNRPLTVGDQLYADDGAQAEIHVPGAALRLGSATAFQFLNLDDSSVQVRLSEGSLNVRVRRLAGGQTFEIDTTTLAFTIQQPGVYRIDTNPDASETYVTVRDGGGQVTGNAGTFPLYAGQQAVLNGQDQTQYSIYAAPDADDFDNWALSRDHREDRIVAARYVSPDVVGYEDLDQYGSWRSVPDYGQCWVPNNMAGDWAPYHNGHWAWVDPWGWTWVDDQPWGFAPFHYGRWAFVGGTWLWAPGPVAVAPVYAPALVAWVGVEGGGFGFNASFGAGGGAVGWFPLGPRDVFIPSYTVSREYVTRVNVSNTTVINNTTIVNVYNDYTRTGTVSTVNYTNRAVPGAVVAVPQNALTSARPVQQVGVRVQASQLSSIKAVAPAPHVAPQMASVLGRPTSAAGAPHPPAAVLSRGIVAKSTPPPARASFQQRATALAQNPGRPLTVQQQQQIVRAAPQAASPAPPVKVFAQMKQIAPKVNAAPAPHPPMAPMGQRPGASQPARAVPPPVAAPQTATRPNQPPAPAPQQQNRPAPAPQSRPTAPPQERTPAPPNRPPAVEERRAEPAPTNRPTEAPRAQPAAPPKPSAPAPQERRAESPRQERRPAPARPGDEKKNDEKKKDDKKKDEKPKE